MTISSDNVKNSYAGNGAGKDFAITFTYFDNSEIQVYLRASAGTEALKVLTTHYTISGSPGSSPLVSMVTAPASGETIVIKRNIPFTQLTDYTAGDAFPAESHETALDKLAALCQQLKETLSRALVFPNTYSTLSDVKLPEPLASAVIKWDSTATSLVNDATITTAIYKISATTADDTVPGYLNDKLVAGTGIDKSPASTTGLVDQKVTLAIDSTVATLTGTQTLTNKTLTTPVVASLNQASGTNTLTMPAATDTLVGRATTDTLTNKSIDVDNNTITNIEVDNLKTGVLDSDISTVAGTHTTVPSAKAVKDYSDSATQTLTNKSIDVDNNTITNIEVDNLKSGVLDTDISTVSGSDDTLASAKAIKTYVDAEVTAINDDATTSNKGVASFSSANFAVSSGAVTIKTGGVDNDELAGSIAASKLAGSIADTQLNTIATADKVSLTALNIDGGTGIDAVVDADLFIVDDGAGGTNKKATAAQLDTYIKSKTIVECINAQVTGALTSVTIGTDLFSLGMYKALRAFTINEFSVTVTNEAGSSPSGSNLDIRLEKKDTGIGNTGWTELEQIDIDTSSTATSSPSISEAITSGHFIRVKPITFPTNPPSFHLVVKGVE